jgi:hypothetical protein
MVSTKVDLIFVSIRAIWRAFMPIRVRAMIGVAFGAPEMILNRIEWFLSFHSPFCFRHLPRCGFSPILLLDFALLLSLDDRSNDSYIRGAVALPS